MASWINIVVSYHQVKLILSYTIVRKGIKTLRQAQHDSLIETRTKTKHLIS